MTEWSSSARRIAAVVTQEMRSSSRQKTPFILRGFYASAIVGLVTLVTFNEAGERPTGDTLAQIGEFSFAAVSTVQLLLAVSLGAFLGLASIHGERLNKTLGLLVLSRLHSWEVILGKLTALFVLLFSVLLAGLPIFALIGWAGGVDYVWLLRLTLLTLMLAAASIATGLASGVLVRSVGLAGCMVAVALILPIVVGVGYEDGYLTSWVAHLLAAPAAASFEIVSQNQSTNGPWLFKSFLLLAHWIFGAVLAATLALPKSVAASPGRGLRGVFEQLDGFFERINLGGIRFGGKDRRVVRGNPVTWLAHLSVGSDLPRYKFRLIAVILVAVLVSLALWLTSEAWGGLLIFAGCVVFLIAPVVAASGAFGAERSRRTLSTLLATPLSARTIIFGKIGAVRRLYLYLTLPSLFLIVFMTAFNFGSISDSLQNFSILFAESLCAYCITLLFATPQRSAIRGAVAGAAFFGFLHLCGLFCMLGMILIIEDEYRFTALGIFFAWGAGLIGYLLQARQKNRQGFKAECFIALSATVSAIVLTSVAYQLSEWNFDERYFFALYIFFLLLQAGVALSYLIRSFDRSMDRSP